MHCKFTKKSYACKVFLNLYSIFFYSCFKLIISFTKKYSVIHITNLSVKFEGKSIFEDFSYSIDRGEKIALTGESGIGKSTLLNVIAGFIPQFEGNIEVCGIMQDITTIREIREKIAWLPQDTSLNSKTVSELLYTPFEFALNKHLKPQKEELFDLFSIFNLDEDLLSKKVKEISGGQKQRIILISCLLLKKPVFFLDEPTSALDKSVKKTVTDHILSIRDQTVIASTHDEYWIKNSDKVIRL